MEAPGRRIDCYFDFVSPWSYLALERLEQLPDGVDLALHPLLFAGLLKHWGHLGPAEIPAKRLFTLRHVQWVADRRGVPLTIPPEFPFNPVPLLRLALAAGATPAAVRRIFRYVWREGRLPDSPQAMGALRGAAGISEEEYRASEAAVKKQLRDNGERAIARGVFGVPTFIVDEHLFWGDDGMTFLLASLQEPALLDARHTQRLKEIPGIERRRS